MNERKTCCWQLAGARGSTVALSPSPDTTELFGLGTKLGGSDGA